VVIKGMRFDGDHFEVRLLSSDAEGTRAHVRSQRRLAPSAVAHFSCKTATSEGAEGGAMGADHGPPQLPAIASVRELGDGGHAPVVAVLGAAG
jgi:hypothetical protein